MKKGILLVSVFAVTVMLLVVPVPAYIDYPVGNIMREHCHLHFLERWYDTDNDGKIDLYSIFYRCPGDLCQPFILISDFDDDKKDEYAETAKVTRRDRTSFKDTCEGKGKLDLIYLEKKYKVQNLNLKIVTDLLKRLKVISL